MQVLPKNFEVFSRKSSCCSGLFVLIVDGRAILAGVTAARLKLQFEGAYNCLLQPRASRQWTHSRAARNKAICISIPILGNFADSFSAEELAILYSLRVYFPLLHDTWMLNDKCFGFLYTLSTIFNKTRSTGPMVYTRFCIGLSMRPWKTSRQTLSQVILGSFYKENLPTAINRTSSLWLVMKFEMTYTNSIKMEIITKNNFGWLDWRLVWQTRSARPGFAHTRGYAPIEQRTRGRTKLERRREVSFARGSTHLPAGSLTRCSSGKLARSISSLASSEHWALADQSKASSPPELILYSVLRSNLRVRLFAAPSVSARGF